MLRVHVVAPENVRIGNLMLDHRLERPAARQLLLELEAADRADRKAKFGKTQRHRRSLRSGAQRRIAHHGADGRADRDRGGLRRLAGARLSFARRRSSSCSFRCA